MTEPHVSVEENNNKIRVAMDKNGIEQKSAASEMKANKKWATESS
jgi:hypothetical protein